SASVYRPPVSQKGSTFLVSRRSSAALSLWPASTHSSRRALLSSALSSYSANASSGCVNSRVRNDGSVTVRSSTACTASVDIAVNEPPAKASIDCLCGSGNRTLVLPPGRGQSLLLAHADQVEQNQPSRV